MSKKLFDGKVVIVTGAGRGIGRAIALRFAKEGASIAVNDINFDSAKKVVGEIKSLNGQAIVLHGDASKNDDVKRLVKMTLDKFGETDILVNNVGFFTYFPLIVDMKEEDWDRCMEINVKSTFLWSKYVAKHMMKRKYGKIINISSGSGKVGEIHAGAYSPAKHAVIGLTRSLALELAPYHINVNAVCPGFVKTLMAENCFKEFVRAQGGELQTVLKELVSQVPLKRRAIPVEIANVVVFLASDEAEFMTGQAINVSGGEIMH